jgi:hypothetical protein
MRVQMIQVGVLGVLFMLKGFVNQEIKTAGFRVSFDNRLKLLFVEQ